MDGDTSQNMLLQTIGEDQLALKLLKCPFTGRRGPRRTRCRDPDCEKKFVLQRKTSFQ
jgi:hypothetical protein